MATIPLQEPVYRGHSGPVFFAGGFRPFFLFTALQAFLSLPLWLAVYVGGVSLDLPFAAALWHGHEMVFGFAGAAIAGFLLTAVPNWTNSHHISGKPLMLLFFLWLAGRLAFTLSGFLPAVLVALVDLSFLPLLAMMMARPLLSAGKWRNIAFLPILALFTLANLSVHLHILFGLGDGMTGVYAGLTMVLTMIAIVGGRIIPSFTQNWLRMQGHAIEVTPLAWLEKGGAVGSVVVGMVLAMAAPTSILAGIVLLLAASIHALRLGRWHGAKTAKSPILWVLHVGYGWLVLGLALLGSSSFFPALPMSAALHALTAGCVGTMIMAVMSRAALGHSGRQLLVSPLIVVAYVLLSLGALLRVVAPILSDAQMALTHAGGSLWALAWGLFVWVYFPILTRPRADGRPG
ncbi:NnrS family protein [Magnetospirillum sulfuroxidans]|uniref:NnrS family protein n=1 Tax=Magnetospirillum sulfuroxidans TaxID=611300 RepID=A0ABS5I7U1_9PROT|nr:NnrS family protein [Magnetospirillum sulfuroxidans]MBR9970491.1 NnrS family protein [Magnetospirillum sulfuroxidans]